MDLDRTWAAVVTRLREELGWVRTSWVDGLTLRTCAPSGVVLDATEPGAREAAETARGALAGAFAEVLGRPVPVKVIAAGKRKAPARVAKGGGEEPEVSIAPDRVNEAMVLSSFLVGPGNELPLRFAREVVDRPGQWNPVTFCGGSGLGKTHLLHGIANGFRRRYPGRRIVYASSERFARQFSFLARKRQTTAFRELYREADLLILDDLQDLAGKQLTERELTNTLDHLSASGRQVVIASANPPKRSHLDRSLEDRLTGGLVVELRTPDRATRRTIVDARCAALGLELGEPVRELLCAGLDGSVRDLLCAMTQLDAHRRHVGTCLDVGVVRSVLGDLLSRRTEPATLDGLCEFVALRLGVPAELLRNGSRRPVVARARQVAMALTRELMPLTLREIGVFFGQRSCASVHAAQARAQAMRTQDDRVREVWEAATTRFARQTETHPI